MGEVALLLLIAAGVIAAGYGIVRLAFKCSPYQ